MLTRCPTRGNRRSQPIQGGGCLLQRTSGLGLPLMGGDSDGKLERRLEGCVCQLEDRGDIAILEEASKKHARQRSSGSQQWQFLDVCYKYSPQANTRSPAEVSFLNWNHDVGCIYSNRCFIDKRMEVEVDASFALELLRCRQACCKYITSHSHVLIIPPTTG